MKRLFLIRHAKSSWADIDLDDFSRPLNKRGKQDAPMMAGRLNDKGVIPQRIVASPAKRAKKTARYMAQGTGYPEADIIYDQQLYLGSTHYHLQVIETQLQQVDCLFLVGHNATITELAEYLSGQLLGNVPTCGIVALEYADGFSREAAGGRLLFFDFPKNPA